MPNPQRRRRSKRAYRLNAQALWSAAAKVDDTSQADIARRTKLGEPAVSRLMNGRYLSLNALMVLSRTYDVWANLLVDDADGTVDESEQAAA